MVRVQDNYRYEDILVAAPVHLEGYEIM